MIIGPSPTLFQAVDIAFSRLRVGGRTWFLHDPAFHFGNWGRPAPSHCEVLSFPCGRLRVTMIQRRTLDSLRFFSFPARIVRTTDTILSLNPTLLALPSIGFGRFNYVIPNHDIPIDMKPLIQDLRSQYSVDFLLGFFSKKFSKLFSSSDRKLLREMLFQKAIPILRLTHKRRLDWYLFLRKRFNLFPPRKRISQVPERISTPAKRKRNAGDDIIDRAKRVRLGPS